MIRLTTIFHGRVQGVGFRAMTQYVAENFEVTGYVRNEFDGSVLCVAEGEEAEVERFVATVHEAMRRNVTSVETTRGAATGEFVGFRVNRG